VSCCIEVRLLIGEWAIGVSSMEERKKCPLGLLLCKVPLPLALEWLKRDSLFFVDAVRLRKLEIRVREEPRVLFRVLFADDGGWEDEGRGAADGTSG
jgi:hypothetical protein